MKRDIEYTPPCQLVGTTLEPRKKLIIEEVDGIEPQVGDTVEFHTYSFTDDYIQQGVIVGIDDRGALIVGFKEKQAACWQSDSEYAAEYPWGWYVDPDWVTRIVKKAV